jgi:hypothetical protein
VEGTLGETNPAELISAPCLKEWMAIYFDEGVV